MSKSGISCSRGSARNESAAMIAASGDRAFGTCFAEAGAVKKLCAQDCHSGIACHVPAVGANLEREVRGGNETPEGGAGKIGISQLKVAISSILLQAYHAQPFATPFGLLTMATCCRHIMLSAHLDRATCMLAMVV